MGQDRENSRAAFYRREASKARRAALNMTDPQLRRQVLDVALSYERMAKMIENLWGKSQIAGQCSISGS
jgi:hypothetical protein